MANQIAPGNESGEPAPRRWLSDAPEFDDIIRAAADYHKILPDLVRKDYWVTRVLRAIAEDNALKGRVLFKGGTSLSKGWKLIDRFSEDIDLLLTGPDFGAPPEQTKDRKSLFRQLRATIEGATPLRLPDLDKLEHRDRLFWFVEAKYHCNIRYSLPSRNARRDGPSSDWLLVESGFRGGVQPHSTRRLSSLIAEFVESRDLPPELVPYMTDLAAFEMDLLKPERTFVEKLLALHVSMSDPNQLDQVRTRFYYDISRLVTASDDVKTCLASGEFTFLLGQAVEISNTYFEAGLDPNSLDLNQSPALNPSEAQVRTLRAAFQAERALYFRETVSFDDILAQVQELRGRL